MSKSNWVLALWILAASLMLNQVSGVRVAFAEVAEPSELAEGDGRSGLEIMRDWVTADGPQESGSSGPSLLRMGGWVLDSLQGPSAVQSSGPGDYGYPDPVTTPVGTLPGNFSVDRLGSANYSVPFEVPPGSNGIQPALGLSYSSGRGMGMVGVGFALTGLSTIERCPKTLIHDGENQGIQLEQEDALCLDGQRLVYVGGGDGYGFTDARYRTRHETFKKIVLSRSTTNPGSSFTVSTKDGRILTYGGDTNARLYAGNGVPFKWALSRVEDRFGNYMTIEYKTEVADIYVPTESPNLVGTVPDFQYTGTKGQRPIRIEYTGNGSKLPQRAVTFDYEQLGSYQRIEGWRQGIYYSVDHLLTQVVMHGPEGEVRAYSLTYDDTSITHRPRLSELRMCDGSTESAVCLPPTVLTWSDDEAGYEDYDGQDFDGIKFPEIESDCDDLATSKPAYRLTLDVDADGGQDFLVARDQYVPDSNPDPNNYEDDSCRDLYHWQIWKASRSGDNDTGEPNPSEPDTPWDDAGFEEHQTGILTDFMSDRESEDNPYENLTVSVINYDGDHRDDVIYLMNYEEDGVPNSSRLIILESMPSFPGLYGPRYSDPDWYSPIFAVRQFVTPDLNGDGYQDLLVCRGDKDQDYGDWYLKMHSGDPDNPDLSGTGQSLGLECSVKDGLLVMDYDGDRAQELLVVPAVENGVILDEDDRRQYFAVELDFTTMGMDVELRPTGLPFDNFQRRSGQGCEQKGGLGGDKLADVNGDGLQDIVRLEPSSGDSSGSSTCNYNGGVAVRVWNNVGGHFVQGEEDVYQGQREFVLFGQGTPIDYNGDGRVDVAFPTVVENSPISYTTRTSVLTFYSGTHDFAPSPFNDEVESGAAPSNDFEPRVKPQTTVPVGDLNGDGQHDVALWVPRYHVFSDALLDRRWQLKVHRGDPPDRLQAVTNGYGASLEIGYQSTRPDEADMEADDFFVYDPATECSDPRQCHTGTRQVVSYYAQDTGVGGQRHHQFQYEDGRTRQGWGWLGFRIVREIEVVEDEIVAIHEREFDLSTFNEDIQDFPFKGVAVREVHQVPLEGGHRVTQTTRVPDLRVDWAWPPLPPGAFGDPIRTYHLPFVGFSTTQEYEIEGQCSDPISSHFGGQSTRCTPADFALELPLRSVTTERELDDYGTVDYEQVTDLEGNVSTTTRLVRNDDGDWLLGLVEQQVTVDRTPSGEEKTRTWEAYYDENGALQQHNHEPSDSDLMLNTWYTRDDHGNVVTKSTVDGWGPTRFDVYNYDDEGVFPVQHINGLGQSTWTDWYRGLGKPFLVADANGVKQVTVRDAFGRVTTEERLDPQDNPDGAQVNYAYNRLDTSSPDGPSRMAMVKTVAGGEKSTVEYDRLGREVFTSTTGLLGQNVDTRTVYEPRGFVERVEELDGPAVVTATSTTHDNLGRPLAITTGDGRTTSFDYEGLLTRTTDPKGNTSETTVDARDRVVRVERYGIDAADLVCYEYAPFNHVNKVKKGCSDTGSNVVQIEPDAYGNNLYVNDPALGPRSYQYDGYGDVRWSEDAKGQATYFQYDALGRLTQRDNSGEAALWYYDTSFVGAFYRSESPDGHAVEHDYDAFGRLIDTFYTMEGRTYMVRRVYDEFSRLYWLKYPNSMTTWASYYFISYRFDDYGHVIQALSKNPWAEHHLWKVLDVDHRGRITSEQSRGGTTTERIFDPHTGTIDSITNRDSNGAVIQRLDYDYDDNLNLESRSEGYGFSYQEETFLYDALDRVKQADVDGLSGPRQVDVNYNDNGDITYLDGVGSYSYHVSTGRLEDAGNLSFEHDANGNVVSRQIITQGFPPPPTEFDYNAQDKIRSIQSPSDTLEFEYDADGNRVLRRSSAEDTTTYYVGDFMEEIWEDGASRPSRRYKVYADGRVVMQVLEAPSTSSPQRTRYFLHPDHLGSPCLVTNQAGNEVQRMYYDMWGAKRGDDWTSPGPYLNPAGINVGFTGHEEQIDGGLMNMRGRMYDPKLGRFMSADPIVARPETLQGWNRYAYVENNPLKFVDPSGHEPAETKQPDTNTDSEGAAFVADWICSGVAALGIGGGCDVNGGDEVPVEGGGEKEEKLGGEQGQVETGKGSAETTSVGCDERDNRCLLGEGYGGAGEIGGRAVKAGEGAIDAGLLGAQIAEFLLGVGAARSWLTKRVAREAAEAGVWARLRAWVTETFGSTRVGSEASTVLLRTSKQLQAKFKHAKDFGVAGNYSKANAAEFSRAIHQHINSPGVRAIQGTYHKQPVTHFLDPSSGLNVIADPAGNFISGWRLSAGQLQNVLKHGGL